MLAVARLMRKEGSVAAVALATGAAVAVAVTAAAKGVAGRILLRPAAEEAIPSTGGRLLQLKLPMALGWVMDPSSLQKFSRAFKL